MNHRIQLYLSLSLSAITLIIQIFWLAVLVGLVTILDIALGVYLVRKLKEEPFDWARFFQGFIKILFYTAVIGITYMISENIFNGSLFEINHLCPKIATMFFITLEARSIDKKSVRLGNPPALEVIRGFVTTVKELYKSFSSITK